MKEYTDEQLREELERREEANRKSGKPELLHRFDTKIVIELCQSYVDQLDKTGYADDDMRSYIFEAAMTMVFGDKVWEWIKKQK